MGIAPIPMDTADRISREVIRDCRGIELDGLKELQPVQVAAQVLDLVHQLAPQVPAGTPIVRGHWQTLWMFVLPGTDPLPPAGYLRVRAHEGRHLQQFWRLGPRMSGEYIAHPELRAGKYEADGFLEHLAVDWAITGQLPTLDDAVASLGDGYGLDADAVALARAELEQGLTSIALGVIRPGPARRTIARLAQENPDYLDAGAYALIQKNCPEVLTGDLQ